MELRDPDHKALALAFGTHWMMRDAAWKGEFEGKQKREDTWKNHGGKYAGQEPHTWNSA